MLDESLLDAPEALARADVRGLLRGTAEAGARVRNAARQAADAGVGELRPDGRPRSVLVAGHGPTIACVADMLAALGSGAVPVTLLRPTGALPAGGALRWTLPGWAGSVDLLVVATSDGSEPGLAALVDQAYRRGCTVVAVTSATAPLGEAVGESRGMVLPLAPEPYPAAEPPEAVRADGGTPRQAPVVAPGTLWALLTPLLALTDRLGLVHAPDRALQAVADRLDTVAERCGPAVETFHNPAKTLAAELAGALPLLWSEGPVATAAARHGASIFGAVAGRPALAAELPEALVAHEAILAGTLASGGDGDDFFRDRVEDPESLHARVVLLRDGAPGPDSAVVAARDLAYAYDTALSELEPVEGSSALEAAAELVATADFAAVYLALADSGRG